MCFVVTLPQTDEQYLYPTLTHMYVCNVLDIQYTQ